jgi:hypothetical protein
VPPLLNANAVVLGTPSIPVASAGQMTVHGT